MHTIELVTTSGKSIYRGIHNTLNEAIESAIQKNIPLHDIDLSFTDLHHINLDGVIFQNASFKGSNLTGANMSEADFLNCDFSSANLQDACLCYSNINNCNFRLSELIGADIAMASLENCEFEGFSAFHFRFQSAFKTHNLTYHHFTKQHQFNSPPILIQCGDVMVALLEKALICKGISHTFEYDSILKLRQNTPLKKCNLRLI
jgi:uncharacterized protein YjbI with pentapeptide repeats